VIVEQKQRVVADRLRGLNPGDAWAHYDLANLARDKGDITEAIALYRTTLELQPDHAAAHNNLGVLLAESTRTEASDRPVSPGTPRRA